MVEEGEFATGDAGASLTYPTQVGSLKKNGYVVIKGHPCKIVEYSTSKTGKHGHAKASIVGIDIFTQKKYEDQQPTGHNMEVPNITRKDFQLVDISNDGFVSLMDDQGNTKEDIKLPLDQASEFDELGKKLKAFLDEGKDVTVEVVSAMGIEKILAMKENK